MSLKTSYESVGSQKSFVIESNIIKGIKKDIDIPVNNIAELIFKKFSDKPQHVGQIEVETGRQTTYEEMKEKSIRCALWLRKQEIQSNDVVAICTHNQIDAYIPCFATFFIGAIYNPWFHEVDLDSAQYLMSLTEPKVIFCCASVIGTLKKAAKLEKIDAKFICFEQCSETENLEDILELQAIDEVKRFKLPTINKDETGIILFSSGSTGQPKGIAHTYDSLLKNAFSYFIIPKKPTFTLWYSSLYWMSGTYGMLQTVILDATRILHKNFDLDRMCQVIEKFEVDWTFIGALALTIFCKSNIYKRYKLGSLKTILTGSSRLSKNIMKELKKHFSHISFNYAYGLSELGKITVHPMDSCKNIQSVGFVTPNVQLKIVDVESKKILGPNEPGEICHRSHSSMLGYVKNPKATEETIDKEGWVYTGDYGYYNENGEIIVLDRIKEIIRFRRDFILPTEIEEVLLDHPSVMEVAVVSVPHDEDLERAMAFVKIVPGSQVQKSFKDLKITEEALMNLSLTLGKNKKLWGGVRFLDELPYTGSGKINRTEIKEIAIKECKI